MKNISIINLAKKYIDKFYPNQYASLLTGSYAEGKETKYSDVDIIIFVTDRIKKYTETLKYQNFTLQLTIISVENISEILFEDYQFHKGVYISMISKGVILYDKDDFLKNLIYHTKFLYKSGSKPLTNEEINKYRARITFLLNDMKGEMDKERLLFVLIPMIEFISEFKLRILGLWGMMGKTKADALKRGDLPFYKELQQKVKLFFEKGDKGGIIELVQNLLNSVGGELLYTSNTYQLTSVSENMVTFRIFNTFKNIQKSIFLKQVADFLKSLNVDNFHFIQMKYEHNEEIIYLIINKEEEIINEILIPKIINKIPKSELIDIYSFYPYSSFSSLKNYKILSPLFEFLSDQMINNLNNEDFQIKKGIQLLRAIRKTTNMSPYEYKVFIKYLLDCWLIYNYDEIPDNKIFNFFDKQQRILNIYEKTYITQEEHLKKVEQGVEEEIILSKILPLVDYTEIPTYKTFLINLKGQEIRKKEFSFYREIISYCLSIIFIKKTFISYLPYIELKLLVVM